MSQPDVDQELERLLKATRAGTEPDTDARARVRAALAAGLVGAGASKVGVATRVGLGAKLWLISAFGVAVLLGVGLLKQPAEPRQASVPAPVSAAASPATPAAALAAPLESAAAPVVALPDASAAGSAAHSEPPQARSASQVAEPADELALVSSMQLALRSGNPPQALALANEHARRFPGGALAQEREGARAIAHCQLAKPETRPAILANFEQRYAGSPYAARVRDACTR